MNAEPDKLQVLAWKGEGLRNNNMRKMPRIFGRSKILFCWVFWRYEKNTFTVHLWPMGF